MAIRLVDVLKSIAPHARPEYLEAFDRGGPLLQKAGLTTPVELAPFLATILEETGGLVVTWESMTYTHAERICEVWPKRFPTIATAEPFVRQPEKLANFVYANRMGNGGVASGDGWKNRGCGLAQNTGADDRKAAAAFAGADFVGHPELMLTAEWALHPAVWEWGRSNLNVLARAGNFREITRIWNGGYTNMDERESWLAIVKEHIDGQEIDLSAPLSLKAIIETQGSRPARTVSVEVSPAIQSAATSVKSMPVATQGALGIGGFSLIAWVAQHPEYLEVAAACAVAAIAAFVFIKAWRPK